MSPATKRRHTLARRAHPSGKARHLPRWSDPDIIRRVSRRLGAPDPAAALARHEQGYASGGSAGGVSAMTPIPAELGAELDANHALMERLGSQATPTIFFKVGSGKLQRVQGAPAADTLVRMFGPKPGHEGG